MIKPSNESVKLRLLCRLQFWAGYVGGRAHVCDNTAEWQRAQAMSEECAELPADEWAMLRFYVRHCTFNFMPDADIKTRWYYIFRKARRDMQEPGGPNDNDLARKLVNLCVY